MRYIVANRGVMMQLPTLDRFSSFGAPYVIDSWADVRQVTPTSTGSSRSRPRSGTRTSTTSSSSIGANCSWRRSLQRTCERFASGCFRALLPMESAN